MKVKDVMSSTVECVRPDGRLEEEAREMKSLGVGSLHVCEGDRVLGIVTDRDIVVRAVADGRDARTTKVQEIMTRDVVNVRDDDDVKDAARVMKEHQVRRVIVVSRDGRLAGIVSMKDLA